MSETRKPLSPEYVGGIFKGAQRALSDVNARRKWGNSKHGSPVATVELCAEIARLNRQIEDAELALNVWDIAHDSEYWIRHPRDPGDLVSAALSTTERGADK